MAQPTAWRRELAIGENIAEFSLAIDQLTNGTEQESHALGAGAGGVRTEFTIACAGGNTVLHRPCDCLSIVAVCRNIREAALALGFRRTGSTPQEGDDLCAGAGLVRLKEAVADTAGDSIFLRPLHGLVVVGAGGHITERACLNFLDKGILSSGGMKCFQFGAMLLSDSTRSDAGQFFRGVATV